MHTNQRNGFPCRCEDCERERRPKAVGMTLDDVFGYVRITQPPIVYGQQPMPAMYERFTREGVCVERREVAPVIRIIYK